MIIFELILLRKSDLTQWFGNFISLLNIIVVWIFFILISRAYLFILNGLSKHKLGMTLGRCLFSTTFPLAFHLEENFGMGLSYLPFLKSFFKSKLIDTLLFCMFSKLRRPLNPRFARNVMVAITKILFLSLMYNVHLQ